MANKIKIKQNSELRAANMSQRVIAQTKHVSRQSISDVCCIAEEKNIQYSGISKVVPGDVSKVSTIYIITGRTDMRRGIDGLMSIISHTYELYPYSSILYLFCGRRCDRIKAPLYEKK